MTGNIRHVELGKINMDELLAAIDTCKGDVYFVTDEGDKINMKSQLARMVGILKVIEGGMFSGGRFECVETDDASKLFRFNLYRTIEA